MQCADDLPARGELLVCGVAAWADAGGRERVFVSGVPVQGIAGCGKGGIRNQRRINTEIAEDTEATEIRKQQTAKMKEI